MAARSRRARIDDVHELALGPACDRVPLKTI
jgi:hypothetical protein